MVTEIFRESVVYRLERNGLRWLYAVVPNLMDALRERLCDDGGLEWTVRAEVYCVAARVDSRMPAGRAVTRNVAQRVTRALD